MAFFKGGPVIIKIRKTATFSGASRTKGFSHYVGVYVGIPIPIYGNYRIGFLVEKFVVDIYDIRVSVSVPQRTTTFTKDPP